MPRKLKVYGWRGYRRECPPAPNGGRQTREVVATPSMAAAARAVGVKSARSLDMCETGNEDEIRTAMGEPGALFWHPLDQLQKDRAWTRVPKEED